jgi:hypothetical protein
MSRKSISNYFSLFTVSTYVLQPPSLEMTIGLLMKIGYLLEGAEMTAGLLISTGHVLNGAAMITGQLERVGFNSLSTSISACEQSNWN